VEAEADEMHGFVQDKANEHWLWLAMDRTTHQIIALHVGDRRLKSARQLWANLPAVYREQATFSTNQSAVYRGAFQRRGTQRSRRKPGKTTHIERCNNTLRQRVSRLVRQAPAFSKNRENHTGAVRDFICHDNLTRAQVLRV
jgi:IS1 family transposase